MHTDIIGLGLDIRTSGRPRQIPLLGRFYLVNEPNFLLINESPALFICIISCCSLSGLPPETLEEVRFRK